MIEELKEWELQEEKRKALHSQVERKRRNKIDAQIAILGEMLPNKIADKIDVLDATLDYVTKLQAILYNVSESSDKYQRVQKYLPPNPNKDIMSLLPSYRPPEHLNNKLGSISLGRRNIAGLIIDTSKKSNSSLTNSAPLKSTEPSDKTAHSAIVLEKSSTTTDLEQSKSNHPNTIEKRRLSLPILTRADSSKTNVLVSVESCNIKDSNQELSTDDKNDTSCDSSRLDHGNLGGREWKKQRKLSILSLLN